MIYSNNNYPPGVNDNTPGAPWNDSDPEMVSVDVCISQTLSKNGITCCTDDYILGTERVTYEVAYEEGHSIRIPIHFREENDFSNTNWRQVINDNNICTPLELIKQFKKTLLLLKSGEKIDNADYWIEQCNGWTEDDLEILQE